MPDCLASSRSVWQRSCLAIVKLNGIALARALMLYRTAHSIRDWTTARCWPQPRGDAAPGRASWWLVHHARPRPPETSGLDYRRTVRGAAAAVPDLRFTIMG